ncbi:uncharacterized protein LOC107800633 isoform X2 [Nicotiana tabacum]|uniref:Uncharacterized protein LOC107800633 isoform X2 n=2 Tax=Nicotiana TaxID=4085 RepID=A0A1S4ARW6_TOBAC|nr:PREDICTED: uncharacterized protein LOC104215247 isoform X2 [Nicotiana sylvestris]XP_016479326.1 PREDICTED: uncharacterized protein LOC107800633 isoform X2 [Nicotiana tabacum]
MSAEIRPVITSLVRTTRNSESVYESKPEVISQASTIPELISYLKSAFRERDFSLVEKILMGREKQLRTEIQNIKRDFYLAEKAHALVELDKLNMEDQMNNFQSKCEVLKKEKAEAEEKYKELADRISILEEEIAKKRDEDVSVIQKMAEDWEAAKEEVVEEGSGNTDFVSAKTNMDNCPDAQAFHPMPSACGSARVNSNLSNLGKKRCRSEEADPLPAILACENRAPIVDLSACEAGDSIKNNLDTVPVRAGSSIVLISDSDDEKAMACVSNSDGVGRNLTFRKRIKEEVIEELSTSLSKRKKSLIESDKGDDNGMLSFAHGSSHKTGFIRLCDDKNERKFYSQLSSKSDLYKLNGIIDSSSDSDNDLSDKSMEILIKSIKGKTFFSEDCLRSSFEKDAELCMKAICALYRQQISPNISSKSLSFTKSQGLSQSDKISNAQVTVCLNDLCRA